MSRDERFYEPSKNDACQEQIEMSNVEDSEPNLNENQKKSTNGCLGFLKKTWAKFTETKEINPDDLDSLDMYYLNTIIEEGATI